MDEIILENLEKEDKELATLTTRALAAFIDSILCGILAYIIFFTLLSSQDYATLKEALNSRNIELVNIYAAKLFKIFLITKFLYLLVFFYMYGASIGNILTKTRIISYEYFDSPNLFHSLARAVVFIMCEVFFSGILFFWVYLNATKRHLADIASKSVVIKVE